MPKEDYATGFELAWARDTLFRTGWRSVYLARGDNVGMPLPDPEAETRVFVVARK